MEAKNDTQKEILDRLNGGEERINYHPQSLIGGEVIDMQEAGLIEAHTDEQGFTYITLPGQESYPCAWCDGTGRVPATNDPNESTEVECSHCDGTGEAGDE